MNKFLIGIGLFLSLLVAAILIGPGLIDWNSYKAELTEQAERFTGRKLTIDGTIEISILPAPALVANDVHLANVEGASATNMVSLKSLQVRVALGPLLSGQIKVQTIHLVDPVIELERFADGRTNLEFALGGEKAGAEVEAEQPESAPGAASETSASPPDEGDGADFSLDNFVVENGTVIYRDATQGSIERVEKLTATFAAASLEGPFESTGSLVAREIPLQYTVSVGRIIEQRTAPVSLTVGLQPGETKSTLSGAIIGLDETPTFKGLFKATGKNLADLIQSLGPKGALPGLLGQDFALEGEVEASALAVDIANMNVSLGNAVATGTGTLELGESIALSLDLGVDSIDIDKWMAMPQITKAIVTAPQSKQEKATGDAPKTSVSLEMPAKLAKDKPGPLAARLPDDVEATLNFSADSLTVNGGLMRHASLSAALSGGEVTISQLSALLPGSADVALFGFIVAADGQPRFDGDMEVTVGDLRGLMGWLGAASLPVPSDRLRKLTLAAKVSANAEHITASDLDIQFDSSRLTGNAVVGLGKRLGIDADLTLDRINLDAYLLPAGAVSTAPPPPPKIAETSQATPAAKTKDTASGGELAVLGVLKNFDANLKARVKTLVYTGAQIKNVNLDGSVRGGAVNVRNLSVDKLAGSTFKASGQIKNLDGIPQLENIRLQAEAGDVSRLLRLLGAEAPIDSKKLGMVSFAAKVEGSVLNPNIDLQLKGAGGNLALAGKASLLPIVGGFDGALKIVHGNVVHMLKALGVDYRPAGKLGGFKLESPVKADLSGLTLSALSANVGPVSMNGAARVDLSGPRTKISADLKSNRIVADVFLPASKSASLTDPARPVAAALVIPQSPASPAFKRLLTFAKGRWPNDPIDLSALKSFDADIKLASQGLVFGNYQLDNADLAASVENGVLRLEKLTGGLFGGSVNAIASIRAASPSSIETTVSLKNLNVARGLMAVIGESPASGKAAMEINLKSSGFTVSDLVAALGGKGSIALSALNVSKAGKGTALSAALGLIAGLNDLGGVLSGKKAGAGLADITGNFSIIKGIATSSDLALTSSMGNGRAQGSIDLSRWLIDVAGQVEMSQNFLGLILGGGQATPSLLPFSIRGNLDAPNVKLDTSKFKGAGLPIPGLDKVLNKKGIGTILQQIIPGLGGSGQTQPSSLPPAPSSGSTPPPPPPPPSSQPQQFKPQDLLKGLLKGLGG